MDDRVFFAGMIVTILGLLILVYDYPQIMYMQTLSADDLQLLEREDLDKLQRVQSEFYVGVGIFVIGAVILFFSKFPIAIFNKK